MQQKTFGLLPVGSCTRRQELLNEPNTDKPEP